MRAPSTNVADLAEIMMSGQTALAWAQSFRRARVRLLLSEDSPLRLAEGGALFLHMIPLGQRNAVSFRDELANTLMREHGGMSGATENTVNADGFLRFATNGSDAISTYLLYLRVGLVEQCIVYPAREQKFIPGELMDGFVTLNLLDHLRALPALGQQFPAVVFVTLMGAKGWTIAGSRFSRPIDRDEAWLEGQVIPDQAAINTAVLTPLLDSIWNCSGAPRSPYAGA